MPSVYIKTYGCQMNERDSEQVAAQLVAKGYHLAATEASERGMLLKDQVLTLRFQPQAGGPKVVSLELDERALVAGQVRVQRFEHLPPPRAAAVPHQGKFIARSPSESAGSTSFGRS